MIKKICVLPNDSLRAYVEKGEIKHGYFNPCNFFDEVHVISLFNNEVGSEEVARLAGSKRLLVHHLGRANLSNYRFYEKSVTDLIARIDPLVIRAFNPHIQGWLGTKSARTLGKPIVISLHTNYDQQRSQSWRTGKYLQFLKRLFFSRVIEPYCLRNADAIICVYRFIVPYAERMGAHNPKVIYNRVHLDRFSPKAVPALEGDMPLILSVGGLIDQRNHTYILEAVRDMNVRLLIIGDGPNRPKLDEYIERENLKERVRIIRSVPNDRLAGYYTSADIFALPLVNLGGVSITVLEAMACGLPVVMSRRTEGTSEVVDDAIYFVDNESGGFKAAFERILADKNLKKELKNKSIGAIREIEGSKMEERELAVYKGLF